MRRNEEMVLELLNASANMSYLIDTQGTILAVNKIGAEMLGKNISEVIGRPISDFPTGPIIEQLETHFFQTVNTGKLIHATVSLKDNYYDVIFYPLFNNDGQVAKLAIYSQDITKVRRKEEHLLSAKEKAEAANKAKTEFLASISHELRTPMQGILGFSKLGREKIHETSREKLADYFTEINSSGQRLLTLLDNLLDLSKLETGEKIYHYSNESLSDMIGMVIKEFAVVAHDKNIAVVFRKPAFDDTVRMDAEKIMQVIRNLLSNALKYSEPDTQVILSIEDRRQDIAFSIADQGLGIPQDELTRVFERFVRSTKTRKATDGTGLGLAICKEIVTDHGGNIWAENNPRGGTLFRFQIPKNLRE
ncbi:MAG: PAS domain-containing protein [Proteobacteria bacterium]|nr:PAS domain-containing protein [Pseudomonadota bacterium]